MAVNEQTERQFRVVALCGGNGDRVTFQFRTFYVIGTVNSSVIKQWEESIQKEDPMFQGLVSWQEVELAGDEPSWVREGW